MARDSIEQIVCCLMAALALPYLFLSIRLQGADPAQQVATTHFGTVPPDHAWRASSTAQHASALDAPNRTTASAWLRAVPSTAVTAEAALVGVGETLLRPGRDAVEAWLRLRRQTHPGFLGYGRAAGTGTAVGPAHHGVAAMQTAGQLRGRVAGGAALPPGPPSGNAASSSVSLSSEEKALLTRLATPTTRDATAAEERPGGAPRRSPPSKPPPLQPSPVAPPPRHPALPPAPHAGAALPAALPAAPTHELVAESEEPAPLAAEAKRRPRRPLSRCLVFTMDSIESYVARSKRGGASGEITIRESLVKFLRSELNVEADVATSDDHFLKLANGIGSGRYAFVVLDAWTWAAKGWVPKRPLVGHEEKVFLLDFFGAKTPTRQGIRVPPARILTAFPTYPGNTFLGYAIPPARLPPLPGAPGYLPKLRQGVIWGKDPKHYAGREALLLRVAGLVDLHSTLAESDAPRALRKHPNLHFHGHLSKEKWQKLLTQSRFMLGLGNPLVGPSAVDAVVAGAVYINPVYDTAVKEVYGSQHPYLAARVGPPWVCSAKLKDLEAVAECVQRALGDLPALPASSSGGGRSGGFGHRSSSTEGGQVVGRGLIPAELTEEAYTARLETIFGPYLPAPLP